MRDLGDGFTSVWRNGSITVTKGDDNYKAALSPHFQKLILRRYPFAVAHMDFYNYMLDLEARLLLEARKDQNERQCTAKKDS